MNVIERKPNGITNGTEKKSYESVCESTGSLWIKKCSKCHKIQTYSNKYKLERAIVNNAKCSQCSQLHGMVVPNSDVYYRSCSACGGVIAYGDKPAFYTARRNNSKCSKCRHLGIKVTDEVKRKLSIAAKLRGGHPHTKQHRRKIKSKGNPMYGVHRYDNLNPFYGKRHTEEAKRKMRIATCKRVLELQKMTNGIVRFAAVGKREGKYFNQLEKKHGWDGVYYTKSGKQFFVEHLGYFVDYYESQHNIVVEYDEPRHYRNGNLCPKDVVRMEQIKDYLGCEFWRYDAYRNQLVKF